MSLELKLEEELVIVVCDAVGEPSGYKLGATNYGMIKGCGKTYFLGNLVECPQEMYNKCQYTCGGKGA